MTDRPYVRGAIKQYAFGWVVQCPICGKRTKRTFLVANPDARMNAERYWQDHLASQEHADAEAQN